MNRRGMRTASRCLSILLIASTLLSTGCARFNSGAFGLLDLKTDVRLMLEVDNDINPDDQHTSSPVYLRFYELKSDRAFVRADFLELYESDVTVLGDDLIKKQELDRLVPGEDRLEHFVLNPETRYIGIFAEFYQYRDARYKVVFPITAKNVFDDRAFIQIHDNNLVLRDQH